MTRVLIVDDDEAIRETLREALEDEGYEIAEASNGIEGLAKLRASQEGMVVLLDHLMPKLDGLAVLRAVQGDPPLATRHVYILLTARSRISTPLQEMVTSLAITVVRKPFDLDMLFQAVQYAAGRLNAIP
jgi:two-component system nitrogen regulation response regulator NtrX